MFMCLGVLPQPKPFFMEFCNYSERFNAKNIFHGVKNHGLSQKLEDLGRLIAEEIGTDILAWSVEYNELMVTVERPAIVRVLTYLRDSEGLQFAQFMDVCGVDYLGREPRFDVVYNPLKLSP
jgi:hypothetical protein